jgi:hypothetical protein
MLREAIQKVKAEIAYHENEAHKHLQQAEELRKDLRDCFAFFQKWGGKEEPAAAAEESPSLGTTQPGTTARPKESGAAPRHHRGASKRKHAGRRTKKG